MAAYSAHRFAVIGTGAMAAAMMSTFHRAGVHVSAINSRDPERGRRFAAAFGIPRTSEDLESLLKSDEFDAVYIANASADHASAAIASLDAGKAVLCEKPLSLAMTDAEKVAEVAARTGRLCMEGLWIPFLPAYRRFVELARANSCGQPSHLFADFGYPVSDKTTPRLFAPAAGGVLLDRGIYLVALALDIFGPVENVDSRFAFTARGVDQHASLQLLHRGGGQSQLAASFNSLMSNTATLACSEGIIRLEEPLIGAEVVSTRRVDVAPRVPREPLQPSNLRQKIMRGLRQRPLLRRIKRAVPRTRREHLSYGPDPYLPQLLHFLSLLDSGASASDLVPLDLSLSIQRVIAQARKGEPR